jgi:hypothetical protein
MLQPATKALAQVLAGRAGASGQLNHARNLLAHAERLINDRVHNRLIPAEREEFFEQLARLRLTLADADAEAEVQAAEEQVERQPPPPPVAYERLKEMALALARPERYRSRSPRPAEEAESDDDDERSVPTGATLAGTAGAAAPAEQQERRPLKPLADLPGRLVLPKAGSESGRRAVTEPVALRRPRASASAPARDIQPSDSAPDGDATARTGSIGPDPTGGNGSSPAVTAEPRRRVVRRTRKTKDGLPEGWVVDDDGYVVPRHD